MESILNSIKKMLGPEEDYTHFDTDIIIHINSLLAILAQVGVGPKDGFKITGPEETWEQFIGDNNLLEDVKTYIWIKVKLVFDPPQNASVIKSYEATAKEIEWRLNVAADT